MDDIDQSKSDFVAMMLYFFSFILKIIKFSLGLLLLLFIFAAVAPKIRNVNNYPYIRKTLVFERQISQPILKTMKKNIPTKYARYDLSRWILVVAVFILWIYLGGVAYNLYARAQTRAARHYLEDLEVNEDANPQAKEIIDQMHQKVADLQSDKKVDRKELLKQFVALKKTLDAGGKNLAFLSIDVVNSTGMKIGEDAKDVEYDFMEYNNMLNKIFDSHGVLNSSWTPDGVMACFSSAEAAVQAARDVLGSLDNFNKNVKQMKKVFAIRCGINMGYVYYDTTTPLEEFSDRVVDIAGHMQKYAQPNTIAIAKQVIEPVVERQGFNPAGRKVDDVDVYEWKKA